MLIIQNHRFMSCVCVHMLYLYAEICVNLYGFLYKIIILPYLLNCNIKYNFSSLKSSKSLVDFSPPRSVNIISAAL